MNCEGRCGVSEGRRAVWERGAGRCGERGAARCGERGGVYRSSRWHHVSRGGGTAARRGWGRGARFRARSPGDPKKVHMKQNATSISTAAFQCRRRFAMNAIMSAKSKSMPSPCESSPLRSLRRIRCCFMLRSVAQPTDLLGVSKPAPPQAPAAVGHRRAGAGGGGAVLARRPGSARAPSGWASSARGRWRAAAPWRSPRATNATTTPRALGPGRASLACWARRCRRGRPSSSGALGRPPRDRWRAAARVRSLGAARLSRCDMVTRPASVSGTRAAVRAKGREELLAATAAWK